jgi:hypothetical protein
MDTASQTYTDPYRSGSGSATLVPREDFVRKQLSEPRLHFPENIFLKHFPSPVPTNVNSSKNYSKEPKA